MTRGSYLIPLGMPGFPAVEVEHLGWGNGSVRLTPPKGVDGFVLTAEVLRRLADWSDEMSSRKGK